MQRKLVSSGTGWELYMPKDVLKLLGINPSETRVLFKMDKNVLKIIKTAKSVARCKNTEKAIVFPLMPNMLLKSTKCPLEDTGKNSVAP